MAHFYAQCKIIQIAEFADFHRHFTHQGLSLLETLAEAPNTSLCFGTHLRLVWGWCERLSILREGDISITSANYVELSDHTDDA